MPGAHNVYNIRPPPPFVPCTKRSPRPLSTPRRLRDERRDSVRLVQPPLPLFTAAPHTARVRSAGIYPVALGDRQCRRLRSRAPRAPQHSADLNAKKQGRAPPFPPDPLGRIHAE